MPSYFDGSTPFGTAWGIHIYWQEQVFGPTIEGTEERHTTWWWCWTGGWAT